MLETIIILGLLAATAFVIVNGHKKAVAASEAAMRTRLDSEGEFGEAKRKLLREAGFNV